MLADEIAPGVVEAEAPHLVVWSSLWPKHPDALIRFDLPPDDSGQGTDLAWTLLLSGPEADATTLGHLRKRLNMLINADLRYSFGQ